MCEPHENESAADAGGATFGGAYTEPEPLSELLNALASYFMANPLGFTIHTLVAVALIALVASIAWHAPKAIAYYRGEH